MIENDPVLRAMRNLKYLIGNPSLEERFDFIHDIKSIDALIRNNQILRSEVPKEALTAAKIELIRRLTDKCPDIDV